MTVTLRLRITTGAALVGASLIVAAPLSPPSPPDVRERAVQLMSGEAADTVDPTTVALLMGGSGQPQVSPSSLVDHLNDVYIQPNFPGAVPQPLGTPEQLYPLVGIHNGFLAPSVQSGVTILNDAINQQLTDGNNVVVVGISQSATISSVEMGDLMALPASDQPTADQLSFLLLGDPDLPNGGLMERFDYPGVPGNLTLPTLGVEFYGATPADTPYPTVMINGEYDGFADFPQYPANLLADINALLGIVYVHGPMETFPAALIDKAFVWQTSPGYDGDTTYYLFPTENLPLLDPIRGNPVGNAIADLLQPDLKVLVNLGYGPDNLPYSEYPNVPTPASGLFPDVNPITVLNELVAGAKEGIQNFVADLKGISPSSFMSIMTNASPPLTVTPIDLDPSNFTTELQTVLTDNSNTLATLVAAPLDAFMPGVDTSTAVVANLPTLDINLLLAGLHQLADGNINTAFSDFTDPIGANTGLLSVAAFEIVSSIELTALTITSALQSAVHDDEDFIAGLPGLF